MGLVKLPNSIYEQSEPYVDTACCMQQTYNLVKAKFLCAIFPRQLGLTIAKWVDNDVVMSGKFQNGKT